MARRNAATSRLQVLSSGPLPSNANLAVPSDQVNIFNGHTSKVSSCSWSPQQDILATASADATARLWDFSVPNPAQDPSKHFTLTHLAIEGPLDPSRREVTSVEWNHDGTRLLTGAFDGYPRIWDKRGRLIRFCIKHENVIFASRWNKNGTRFLTAGADKTVMMWHTNTGALTQAFKFHTAAVLDVDWLSNASFASCSKDNDIHVCELDRYQPIRSFKGHRDDVNAVKWDPAGKLLASCSDDETIRLWSMDNSESVRNLIGHSKEVYRISWRPTGLQLASASFDGTVRLWDVETGVCTGVMNLHNDTVNCVAFSPDGRFLASGSSDRTVQIWSVESGALLQYYRADSGIYEIRWNSDGTLLAICTSGGSVIVLDFRR